MKRHTMKLKLEPAGTMGRRAYRRSSEGTPDGYAFNLCVDELQEWFQLPRPLPKELVLTITPDDIEEAYTVLRPDMLHNMDTITVLGYTGQPHRVWVARNFGHCLDWWCRCWNATRLQGYVEVNR